MERDRQSAFIDLSHPFASKLHIYHEIEGFSPRESQRIVSDFLVRMRTHPVDRPDDGMKMKLPATHRDKTLLCSGIAFGGCAGALHS